MDVDEDGYGWDVRAFSRADHTYVVYNLNLMHA